MPKAPKQFDLDSYNDFIRGLELIDLRLVDASIQANISKPEGELQAKINDEYSLAFIDEGFEAYASYKLFFYGENVLLARLEATFGLIYTSRTTHEQIEEFFELFKQTNLPLNAWPFAREFFHNMLGRMGWPPFTLPLLKALPPNNSGQDQKDED